MKIINEYYKEKNFKLKRGKNFLFHMKEKERRMDQEKIKNKEIEIKKNETKL